MSKSAIAPVPRRARLRSTELLPWIRHLLTQSTSRVALRNYAMSLAARRSERVWCTPLGEL